MAKLRCSGLLREPWGWEKKILIILSSITCINPSPMHHWHCSCCSRSVRQWRVYFNWNNDATLVAGLAAGLCISIFSENFPFVWIEFGSRKMEWRKKIYPISFFMFGQKLEERIKEKGREMGRNLMFQYPSINPKYFSLIWREVELIIYY